MAAGATGTDAGTQLSILPPAPHAGLFKKPLLVPNIIIMRGESTFEREPREKKMKQLLEGT